MIWPHEDFSDDRITAEHLKYIIKNQTILNVEQLILGGVDDYKIKELLVLMINSFRNLRDIMISFKKEDSLDDV
jgi:hypothetical protein